MPGGESPPGHDHQPLLLDVFLLRGLARFDSSRGSTPGQELLRINLAEPLLWEVLFLFGGAIGLQLLQLDKPMEADHSRASMSSLGIAAGLATAGLWTATAVCFEASSRRLGSFPVNVLRLLLACVMFFVLSLVRSGTLLPAGLSVSMWCQLIVSGVTGFVLGDLLLFEAFVLIGARLSMLIYASVPSMTALAAFLCLDEAITVRHVLGMAITLLGIATAILGGTHHTVPIAARNRRRGVAYAIGGSAGQAAGLLFGKSGSVGLDAFAATEVRVIAGLAGFVVFAMATRRIGEVVGVVGRALCPTTTTDPQESAQLRHALGVMVCGAVLGPFLGVSLGLKSVQLLPTGVASTLMSIVPALLVPVSVLLFRERVRATEVLGTVVTLVGVAVLSL